MFNFNNDYNMLVIDRVSKIVVLRSNITAHTLIKAIEKASKIAADNGYDCLNYQISVKEGK